MVRLCFQKCSTDSVRIQTKIAVAVALLGAASMAQAVSITFGGCKPSDASGQTTCVAGATVVNFNGSLGGLPAGYTSTGGAGGTVVTGTASQFAQPGGATSDLTPYLSTPSPGNNAVGEVTAVIGGNYNYFGLYWGSMDAYNTLSFYNAQGTEIASLTGAQVIAQGVALGNQTAAGSNQYVNFWFGGQTFDKVVFDSTNFAFESDNHAYANVPEPATLGLLGLGLAGVGFMRRRKAS